MKKGLLAILMAAAILLTVVFGFFYMTEDRQGPEIQVNTSVMTYADGSDTSSLLAGVTAMDSQDGDVSDTLRVERVLTNIEDGVATVIYTAKDNSNNVSKLSVQIALPGGSTDAQDEVETDTEPKTTPEADTSEPTETPTPTSTPEPEELTGEVANEAKIAELSDDAPRFYLSQYELTISAGQSINRLSYVSDIQDDEDDRNDLFQKIQIEGEVDTSTPGNYELDYFVIDSDGNVSNRAVLEVTVE